jgi:integrase
MPQPTRNTVKVIARHRADCPVKSKGMMGDIPELARCKCPKSLLVYEADRKKQYAVSAHTTSWAEAEKQAQEKRDSFDPRLARLQRLEAEKEAKAVRIEEAVALYVADMAARLGDNGTVEMARALFGHVNPETKQVEKNGHLFNWLEKIPAATRPTYIADITTAHLTQWRASWKFADYTAAQRWGMVRSFFNFCESQGWIQDSPARKLRRVEYAKGGRTAIFTDRQYQDILGAIPASDPENVPAKTRASWRERITAFVELLRWSGMAPIDAVQFRPEWVDDEGVLRYRRQKTSELATVQLPEHVVTLLRNVPLERDSVGPDSPFRMKNFTPDSDRITWSKRLMRLFELAGIKEVRNDLGRVRPPHVYMLRDTFAVWNLRHGVPLHALSKMIGHANPVTTAKHYLPWVKELETATIEEGRKALAKVPKVKDRKVVDFGKL